MARRTRHWIVRSSSCPTMSKRGLLVTCMNSSGKGTLGRSNRRLMQSSRKDRAPLLAPPIAGSFCALAERDSAAAERALVALGDNACWTESAIAQQEKIAQAQPGYGSALCILAMIDAALGHKEQALKEGRRALALMPLEKDVTNGSRVIQYFAITAAWTGEMELALQQLETGLRVPTASIALSYGALKLLPFWDPLRGDSRFEKIVASLAPKEPSK
jgi:tetratricopeptide (TPR) repeat protein